MTFCLSLFCVLIFVVLCAEALYFLANFDYVPSPRVPCAQAGHGGAGSGCTVRAPDHLARYITRYRRPSVLMGQWGYCLINLTSAVEFLERVTAAQLTIDEDFFRAQLDAAEQRVLREDSQNTALLQERIPVGRTAT